MIEKLVTDMYEFNKLPENCMSSIAELQFTLHPKYVIEDNKFKHSQGFYFDFDNYGEHQICAVVKSSTLSQTIHGGFIVKRKTIESKIEEILIGFNEVIIPSNGTDLVLIPIIGNLITGKNLKDLLYLDHLTFPAIKSVPRLYDAMKMLQICLGNKSYTRIDLTDVVAEAREPEKYEIPLPPILELIGE